METIFVNTQNSKRNELHKLVLNLTQRLDLRSSNSGFLVGVKCSRLYQLYHKKTQTINC